MAEIKSGIFAKNVQKRLNRAQEKVLQKLGKADETRDEQFEQVVVNFRRQESEGARLQREMKTYMSAIKGMQQASINLTQSLHEVYELEWHGKEDIVTIGKDCDALWEDFHNKLVDSTLLNLDAYLQEFPDLKLRVAKRSRKLIDYDSARHHLETLQTSGMKNDRKVMKAEEELKKAQKVFDELDVGLQDELPTLWDRRVGFYISTFKSVTTLEAKFHREISQVCRELYEIMTKLGEQHSDKIFTIQGAPSDSGPLRLARTPSPPEDESPHDSPDAGFNHMLHPVSPGPPRPKSPIQLKKGPPVPPPPKVSPTNEVAEEQIVDLFGGEFLPAPSKSLPNERPGESLLDLDFDAFQPDENVSPIPQTAVPWDMWSGNAEASQLVADAGFVADWSADFGSESTNGDAATQEVPAQDQEGEQTSSQGACSGWHQSEGFQPGQEMVPSEQDSKPRAEDDEVSCCEAPFHHIHPSAAAKHQTEQLDSHSDRLSQRDHRKSTPGLLFTDEFGEEMEDSTGHRGDKWSRSLHGSGSEYETAEEWGDRGQGGGWVNDDGLSFETNCSEDSYVLGVHQTTTPISLNQNIMDQNPQNDLTPDDSRYSDTKLSPAGPTDKRDDPNPSAAGSDPSVDSQDGAKFGSDLFVGSQGGAGFGSDQSVDSQDGAVFSSDPFVDSQDGAVFGSDPFVDSQDGAGFGSDPFVDSQDGAGFGSDPFVDSQDGAGFGSDPFVDSQDGAGFGSDPFVDSQDGAGFGFDPFVDSQGGSWFGSDLFVDSQDRAGFGSDPFVESQDGPGFGSDPFVESHDGAGFGSDSVGTTRSVSVLGPSAETVCLVSSGLVPWTGDSVWDSEPSSNRSPAISSGIEGPQSTKSSFQGLGELCTFSSSVTQLKPLCGTITCGTAMGGTAPEGSEVTVSRLHKEPEKSDMSEDEAANQRFGRLYRELDTGKEEDTSGPSFFADFDKMSKDKSELTETPEASETQSAEKREEPSMLPAAAEESKSCLVPAGGDPPADGQASQDSEEHEAPPDDEEEKPKSSDNLKEKLDEKMPIPSVVIEPASSNEGDDDRDADIISPTNISDNGMTTESIKNMSPSVATSGRPDDFLYKVETMHDFEAANSDELDLKKGDLVLVVPTTSAEDQDAGWLTGIKESDWLTLGVGAQRGLFPENFTQRLE